MPTSTDLHKGASIETDVVAKRFSDAAGTYDAWSHPLAVSAKGLVDFLPKEAKEVLDVGCGTGLVTSIVREKYPEARIVGMDPAPGMIEFCRKKWKDDPRCRSSSPKLKSFYRPRFLTWR